MAENVLLLVKYGSDSEARIRRFKTELGKAGWRPAIIDGAFEKRVDLPFLEVEMAVQEEVDSAANTAGFSKTCCDLVIITDKTRFCWDWNSP